MNVEKTFSGVLSLDGDDGNCYGYHLMFSGENLELEEKTAVVDFLDEIASKYEGKKVNITIKVELS